MSANAALDAARVQYTGAASADVPPSVLWDAAEAVLQAAFRVPAVRGQALIGEGRRLQAITLADAHALVALLGWGDRVAAASPVDDVTAQWQLSRDGVARDAWTALEHAVSWRSQQLTAAESATAPIATAPIAVAPIAVAPIGVAPIGVAPIGVAPIALAPPRPVPPHEPTPAPLRNAPRPVRPWLFVVAVLTVAALGVLFYRDGARDGELTAAIAAYGRGDRSAARAQLLAFASAHPDDGRPLIYLGRIAREDGDAPTARRYLQSATTKAPTNPLAHRELAATLLASGDLELARRFYVRAVELDPADRLAQGFLACTLHRLGREDDAQRFAARAGEGEWHLCLAIPVPHAATSPSLTPSR